MKTFKNNANPEIKIISFRKNRKTINSSNSEINDKFVSLFCKQIYFGDRFREKFNTLLVETDFAYPTDAKRIKETIDKFIESSNQMLGDYIENAIELTNKENEIFVSSKNEFMVEDAVEVDENESWTNEWIEQTESLREKFWNNNLLDTKMENYFYYSDVAVENF